MKVCKYCGAENDDKAKTCSSCGANQFKYKCGNCGTILEEGEYCPKCGVKAGQKAKECPKCGKQYYSAACPDCGYTPNNNRRSTTTVYVSNKTAPRKKRKTWLWVLGWIIIFPVPLMILVGRSQKLRKGVKIGIIAVAWIFYLLIAFLGGSDESSTTDSRDLSSNPSEVTAIESNIKKLSFLSSDDITLKVGQKKSSRYLNVSVESKDSFRPDDVIFVSDDPSVATIDFSHDALTTYLYYEIKAVGEGETYVYATSTDGSVVSEKIKVTVPQPIQITSITVTPSKTDLYIGETASAKISYLPTDAEDKTLTWESSDESVATVDSKGMITAVGSGTVTITVSASNGVSGSFDITVSQPIEIKSITVTPSKTDLYIGETVSATASCLPTDAEDKTLTWESSDESVATVDSKGMITAVGNGMVTITVSASNGVCTSFDATVDGSKRVMKLRVTHPREDDINIGNEWSYLTEINGERTSGMALLSVGDKLTLHAKITEEDDNPDVGENTTTYTVNEEDIQDGFNVSMDVYVTENGGKNSGQSAHFVVTYTFTPKEA